MNINKSLLYSVLVMLVECFCSLSAGAETALHTGRNGLMRYAINADADSVVNPYRSVLFMRDGTRITTENEWKQRRREIRDEWLSIIGEWPEIIKGQRMELVDSVTDGDITRYTVSFNWLPGQKTTGYLLVPHRCGNPLPAVITFFYEPETSAGLGGKPYRDFALQLARRGFVALSLGSTETTRDKTYGLYYPSIEDAVMEPLSAMAYAAANAYEALALDDRVDASRIGVMGHSYGGKWAMFASCLYDKFACAAWGDPGVVFDETKAGYINYWEPWYLGYRRQPWVDVWREDGYRYAVGAYKVLRSNGHDLHELHALMAPRPFLVSGGFSDGQERLPVLSRTAEVNRLLGYENRIYFTQRPLHDPDAEANEVIYAFFIQFLMNNHANNTY